MGPRLGRLLVAAGVGACLAGAASAQSALEIEACLPENRAPARSGKSTVAVEFRVAAPDFRRAFEARGRLAQVEARAAERIAAHACRSLPFVRWVPASAAAPEDAVATLRVELVQRPGHGLYDYFLEFRDRHAPDGTPPFVSEALYTSQTGAPDYYLPGKLLGDLDRRFPSSALEGNPLIQGLGLWLRDVPIHDEVHPDGEGGLFVVPFTERELLARDDTRFRVELFANLEGRRRFCRIFLTKTRSCTVPPWYIVTAVDGCRLEPRYEGESCRERLGRAWANSIEDSVRLFMDEYLFHSSPGPGNGRFRTSLEEERLACPSGGP